MAQNRNRAKRKCRTSFFPIYNFNLKFEPLDAELNSATENQTHFSKKVGVVPRKAAKFEKVVWNLKKKDLCDKKAQDQDMLRLFVLEYAPELWDCNGPGEILISSL